MNPKIKIFFILLVLSVSKISFSQSLPYLESAHNQKTFKVWALADIQPKNKTHRKAFEDAIFDMNSSTDEIDIAIVAGDIVNRAKEETFAWYLSSREKSYITKWYEIIGNHDLKTDRGLLFRKKLRQEIHYSVLHGNILFIFLSDEERGKPTVIKDETFNWWKKLVIENQDKIIVTVTHASLDGSTIPFSSFDDRKIKQSHRFRKVLREYKVDLWLSGHLHIPHSFTNTIVKKEDLKGTIFTHISSIRPEMLGLKHSESRFLEFYCDSNKLLIKSRDHKIKKWDSSLEEEFGLSKKVICNSN